MSRYRGVVAVYVDEHELGKGEVLDPNIDVVLNSLHDVATETIRSLVATILKGYHADTVKAILDTKRTTGEDENLD